MILRILALAWLLGAASAGHTEDPPPEPPEPPEPEVCLTGQMRDVQSWTDEQGTIIADTDDTDHAAMDLSSSLGPAAILERFITTMEVGKNGRQKSFGYLSMARCNLTSVPQVFDLQDYQQRPLYQTLQYVTFFGNRFSDNSLEGQLYDADLNATGATETSFSDSKFVKQDRPTWDVGFRKIKFPYLLELDLRSCHIQHLHDGIFEGMPALTSLYLANNNIIYVTSHAFLHLTNLVHLDLSHNMASEKSRNRMPVLWQSDNIFSYLPNFTSLDLSLTRLSPSSVTLFRSLGRSFKRLSLCYTGLEYLTADNFKGTNLKLLDVSGNVGILDNPKALNGLQHTLEVLYADSVGLKTLKNLAHFEELKILKASNNEISLIEPDLPMTWKSLQILDLDHNRLSSWAGKLYSLMENLKVLSLRYNNINVVKAPMIQDFQNVSFLGVSGNFFVCTCYNRELFEIAANNDKKQGLSNIIIRNSYNVTEHHVGFHEYYSKIAHRNTVERNCDESNKSCRPDINDDINGEFHLFDYNPLFYNCFVIDDGVTMGFSEVHPCNMSRSDNIDDEYIRGSWTKIVIIGVVATVALPLLILGFLFRRSFSYFYITVKNSAMLSLMADSKCYEDGSIFNYDVFVSYCNEDRPWVLDQLLPHVEKDCNVSVCLHERDFQVGLSILENIVSCMDRSRSIMLVISQRFLLSQWCQFEMHLAQHRLLETRREDLILILLEDIPRRMRPNILHYLMVTKTYVLWPKEDTSEQALFWRRVKKSIYTQKMKHADNVSLA